MDITIAETYIDASDAVSRLNFGEKKRNATMFLLSKYCHRYYVIKWSALLYSAYLIFLWHSNVNIIWNVNIGTISES